MIEIAKAEDEEILDVLEAINKERELHDRELWIYREFLAQRHI